MSIEASEACFTCSSGHVSTAESVLQIRGIGAPVIACPICARDILCRLLGERGALFDMRGEYETEPWPPNSADMGELPAAP